jgi:superfamily II DNA or RNA helicase
MPANSLEHRENSNDAADDVLQPLPHGVEPGALIDLRAARWRLEHSVARGDCRELHVASAADDRRRVFLWPFDRPAAVDTTPRFTILRVRHWRRAIEAAYAREVGPWTPRGRNIRAQVLPYQLEPAIAMARGALRLVLADEVGLGKTVQAGWIVSDLVERERDARILIAVPAGLRRQWHGELDTLFGLSIRQVDAAWLRATVADLPADVSPWSPPGIYVASIDFLKRPDVSSSVQAHLWDLLIVDEAHGSTSPTDRHAALAAIAAHSRRVVSITATPFSGDAARFGSLAALGAVPPDGCMPVMFRRSREEAGDCRRRRHRFVPIRISHAESRLQRLLERYSRGVWCEVAGDVDGARLAVTILRKRALSSPAAAERSLRRRLALLQGRAAAPRQLSFFEDEDGADDDLMDAALAVPGLADSAREQRWLATMVEAAAAIAGGDSKLRRLGRLLERARGEAAIVFTEYRDTLRHLAARMPHALQLHGGMNAAERAAVQREFNEHGGCLLATDAASEGLNLQHRCRLIVNYELPWNPARLEQRIGRVDRIGQCRPVHAITLLARDTAEDLVVANFTKRLTRVAATLGERDRLAGFLDETRVARSVIGVAEWEEAADPGVEPAELANRIDARAMDPPDVREHARTAAAQIHRRLTSHPWIRTPIAAVRSMKTVPPGCVVALRCAARTAAGGIVAERVTLVHVAGMAHRPADAAAVRGHATRAVDRLLRHVDAAVPQLREWLDEIQRTHASVIDAHIAHEAALRGPRTASAPVQRGLFDGRALAEANRRAALAVARHDETSARIRQLEHSRSLQLNVTPAGVLVLWH